MTIQKILIDTNVCLDAALTRGRFAADALKLMEFSEQRRFNGVISAHSFDTIFYFLERNTGRAKAYQGLKHLRTAYGAISIDQDLIDQAIDAGWKDFEDAIHYYSALKAGCDAIVTRNKKDFKNFSLPVLSPEQFLEQIE